MKKSVCILLALLLVASLSSCADAAELKPDADEMLYRGVEAGDISSVMDSVAAGANIDKLKRGRIVSINMVEFATDLGYTHIAEWLINNGADVNYKTSIMGETLLMNIAAAGDYDLCRLLLEKGADIGAKDRLSDTALEYAFKAGVSVSEAEVDRLVTLLLDGGAQTGRETMSAVLNGYSGNGDGDGRYGLTRRVARLLLESGLPTNLPPALEAAVLGDSDAVLTLINEGRISSQDQQKIMFLTAAFGSAVTLQRLDDNGQSLTSADRDGNTPLMLAARYGNVEAVRYLLNESALLNAKNRFGKTAPEVAYESGNTAVARLIEANIPAREAGVVYGEMCRCRCCPHD